MSKILLVEDDALVRKALSRVLKHLGHDVFCVDDGNGALALPDDTLRSYHIVFCDVQMTRISGPTTVRALRARGVLCPVVLISGDPGAEEDGVSQLLENGTVQLFLQKPITLQRFCEVLDRFL